MHLEYVTIGYYTVVCVNVSLSCEALYHIYKAVTHWKKLVSNISPVTRTHRIQFRLISYERGIWECVRQSTI